MKLIEFSQTQRPVGQGGFHIGRLRSVEPSGKKQQDNDFVWVYDCGAIPQTVLNSQIKSVSGLRIDMLFLSHLDRDHVIGVKTLLVEASIKEVVLPYLNDVEWTFLLASVELSDPEYDALRELVENPAEWFGRRHVERITYVECYSDDEKEPVTPDRPEDPTEGEIGEPLSAEWTQPPTLVLDGSSRSAIVRTVKKGAVVSVKAGSAPINWALSPFAFRPSAELLKKFETELSSKFGRGLKAGDYAAKARDDQERKKLRECYNKVWKDHNLHSMALYAGPYGGFNNKLRCTARYGCLIRRIVQPGWLSTGDFNLLTNKRREKFLKYYRPYAGMVGQFMLPHHGSEHSFHDSVLSAFPNLTFAIAAVGKNNNYGHPNHKVLVAVDAAGIHFVRVDESALSYFEVTGKL